MYLHPELKVTEATKGLHGYYKMHMADWMTFLDIVNFIMADAIKGRTSDGNGDNDCFSNRKIGTNVLFLLNIL